MQCLAPIETAAGAARLLHARALLVTSDLYTSTIIGDTVTLDMCYHSFYDLCTPSSGKPLVQCSAPTEITAAGSTCLLIVQAQLVTNDLYTFTITGDTISR